MGAGAAVVLGRAAVRVSGGEWEGLLAAATYAFSPLVWRLSTQYEVRYPTPPISLTGNRVAGHGWARGREYLLNVWRRTVNLRRP